MGMKLSQIYESQGTPIELTNSDLVYIVVVKDGVESKSAAITVGDLVNYLNNNNGPIIGSTVPTTSTVGKLGQLYLNTATSKTYHCSTITNTGTEEEPVYSYTWTDDINAKGGTFTSSISINYSSYATYINSSTIGVGYNISGNKLGLSGCITCGTNCSNANAMYSLVVGTNVNNSFNNIIVSGKYNLRSDGAFIIGGGSSNSNRKNIFEVNQSGVVSALGSYISDIVIIPSSTTSYTLGYNTFYHIPNSSPTYTLPAGVLTRIGVGDIYFRRYKANDGADYYAWVQVGSSSTFRYTASPNPLVGDNSYTNTALTSGAAEIILVSNRTSEIILTVRFSSTALSATFQTNDDPPVTIIPESIPEISDGTVVRYLCSYELLLEKWVIVPVVLGQYIAPSP